MTSARMDFHNKGLFFSFAEMNIEIENMSKLASQFLEENSFYNVVPTWQLDLRNYQASRATTEFSWVIQEANPVRTKPSMGEHRVGGGGGHNVIGELSAIWRIRLIRLSGQKKLSLPSLFSLVGIASTRVRILEMSNAGNQNELARWRFEVGDAQSPGCHFHVQVLGGDGDSLFPKTLEVPRLPGILITPMDALEFLLGEIFQDCWRRETSKSCDAMTQWSGCQKKRLTRVLKWQRDHLETGSGSPWTWLKGRKPEADLLIKD